MSHPQLPFAVSSVRRILGDRHLAFTVLQASADSLNVFPGQFVRCPTLTTFASAIACVARLGAKVQVAWIDAERVVASVEAAEAVWDVGLKECVGVSMS